MENSSLRVAVEELVETIRVLQHENTELNSTKSLPNNSDEVNMLDEEQDEEKTDCYLASGTKDIVLHATGDLIVNNNTLTNETNEDNLIEKDVILTTSSISSCPGSPINITPSMTMVQTPLSCRMQHKSVQWIVENVKSEMKQIREESAQKVK